MYQPGQRRRRIEWNSYDIDEFRRLTKSGTQLYSRIIVEPNSVDLIAYDPLKKIWFSFYDHFLAKHLNNDDKSEQT